MVPTSPAPPWKNSQLVATSIPWACPNTQVGPEIQGALEKMESLQYLYAWNTQLSEVELQDLKDAFSNVQIDEGFIPDENELLKLSEPQMLTKARVLNAGDLIELKHNFPGVEMRYTLDGSTPDSLESAVYSAPIPLKSFTQLNVKAFKPGWLSSDEKEYTFFIRGMQPQEITLLNPPNPQYPGSGGQTLLDGEKGDPNNFRRQGQWLGYKDNSFKALVDFGKSGQAIQKLTVSYLRNIGSYIMPPATITISGGNDRGSMVKLTALKPQQPEKPLSNLVEGLDVELPETAYRYYQVEMEPVRVLPPWHRGAGDQGWVFVDELVFY